MWQKFLVLRTKLAFFVYGIIFLFVFISVFYSQIVWEWIISLIEFAQFLNIASHIHFYHWPITGYKHPLLDHQLFCSELPISHPCSLSSLKPLLVLINSSDTLLILPPLTCRIITGVLASEERMPSPRLLNPAGWQFIKPSFLQKVKHRNPTSLECCVNQSTLRARERETGWNPL